MTTAFQPNVFDNTGFQTVSYEPAFQAGAFQFGAFQTRFKIVPPKPPKPPVFPGDVLIVGPIKENRLKLKREAELVLFKPFYW